LVEEPKRTIETIGFSFVSYVLPASAFGKLKSVLFASRSNGVTQEGHS
jgi:hypothetical protein